MKTLLISFVLVVNLCLTNGASASAPPTEITDAFFSGEIVQYYELVGDGEIKYVGMIRYGAILCFRLDEVGRSKRPLAQTCRR